MMRQNKIIASMFGTTRFCKPHGKNIARPCKGLNADYNYLLSSIIYIVVHKENYFVKFCKLNHCLK